MDTCGKGHLFDARNTYIDPRNKRQCRECRKFALRRWYRRNSQRPVRLSPEERLAKYTNQGPPEACWEWLGTISNRGGYGVFSLAGRRRYAHRYVYERLHGPVVEGKELDHLCRNRRCVNPNHLEPVAHAENVRRGSKENFDPDRLGRYQRSKMQCPQGHIYSKENTKINYAGRRVCRTCEREKALRWYYAAKAKR